MPDAARAARARTQDNERDNDDANEYKKDDTSRCEIAAVCFAVSAADVVTKVCLTPVAVVSHSECATTTSVEVVVDATLAALQTTGNHELAKLFPLDDR